MAAASEEGAMSIQLPSYLTPFKYQIAGHHPSSKPGSTGILLHENEDILWKPLQSESRGRTETLFYEIVWSTEYESTDELAPFVQFLKMVVPRFYGLASIAHDPPLEFLQLENVLYGYHYPCVMDVKIGRQTWPPTSTQERIAYEMKKYPHIDKLGFRFLGMSIYDPCKRRRFVRDKVWGRKVQPNDVNEVFSMFFSGAAPQNAVAIVQSIADRLDALHAWFSHQDKFLFYSSSVLIVYEGGRCSMDGAKTDVRMIDFTHVYPSNNAVDDNYIYGLSELLKRLKSYLNECSAKNGVQVI